MLIFMVEVKLLVLLVVANGAPIVTKKLLGKYGAWPLDFNRKLADGQPLLGHSKTLRGLLSAIGAAAIVAPHLGWSWTTGALFGVAAMMGDLVSSFIKRRRKLTPHSMALGLDQIPESLLPCLAVKSVLSLSWSTIGIVVVIFFVGELLLSQLLYKLNIRDRPY
ncbi:MAG: CDP-archaeol synthase [Gammaproteobacteria bacterium]|nr:CDP-archaeol synthase [Gammaproteobacteria bacterium]